MTRIRSAGLLAAAVALVAGCAGAPAGAPAATPDAGASPAADASAAEIEALYRARTDSARMRFTDADVRFMSGMVHHHAQAIEIAQLAPRNGASPSIRTLAARIINAQRDEIATMQRWLRDRQQPVPELHEMNGAVMVHGGGHAPGTTQMPGMLSPEQVASLRAARGAAFDRLFLELMIQHHSGAVTMVHELFATDGAGQDEDVFRFASDVQVDQATEVARMERMLAALPPADRSP